MTKLTHVRVKPGVLDEELGYDMGGWSGRVTKQESNLLTIEWDGPTLRRIPDDLHRYCLDNGYETDNIRLLFEDVEPNEPTDTPSETAQTLKEMEDRYHDYELYQVPPFPFATHPKFKISDGLPRTTNDWFTYLKKSLKFPFEALSIEGHFLPYRAEVTVTGFDELTDRYGILIEGTMLGMDHFTAPLANLMGLDARKKSTKLVKWYRIWFANQ